MPRRIPDYPDVFYLWNSVATFGSYITTCSLIVFVLVIYKALIGFSWSTDFFTIFGINYNLPVARPYKLLLGTTSNDETTSVRVLHRFLVKRAINYKTAS